MFLESLFQNPHVRKITFILLILATILVPVFTQDSVDLEYVDSDLRQGLTSTSETVYSLIGAFLVFIFLLRSKIDIGSRLVLILLSLVPGLRLIIAIEMFLSQITNTHRPLNEKIKGHFLVLIGFFCIYNILFAFPGLLFFTGIKEVIPDVVRLSISSLFIYAIYKQNIQFGRWDFFIHIPLVLIVSYFLF